MSHAGTIVLDTRHVIFGLQGGFFEDFGRFPAFVPVLYSLGKFQHVHVVSGISRFSVKKPSLEAENTMAGV